MGGYTALRFALDLGARGALAFSGPTSFTSPKYREKFGLGALYQAAPDMTVDLLPLYRAARRRPQLWLCYGDGNKLDTHMAQRMSEFAETRLLPFHGFSGHSTFMEAGRRGDLHQLAAQLTELPA